MSKLELLKPAYELMAMGGDTRIMLDEKSGFNLYGCVPYPTYSIAYSSCTSNNISVSAYSFIESYLTKLRKELLDTNNDSEKNIYRREFEQIKNKIKNFYELDTNTELVFGSSGTDLELVVLAISKISGSGKVHNIILEANEVGSGIEYAARGQYFSTLSPIGGPCKIGQELEGFIDEEISYSNIPIRNINGHPKQSSEIYKSINDEIEIALKKDYRPIVHIIHRTKTGLILPSWNDFVSLKEKWGDKIDFVIDACQGRISINFMNRYLNLGAMIILTGSKFYSSPPFSGVLILPSQISDKVKNSSVFPIGVRDFFTKPEFPENWKITDSLYDDQYNLGLLLRWQSAIYEMNKIFMVPNERIKNVILTFSNIVKEKVAESSYIKIVESPENTEKDIAPFIKDSPFELNTIITLSLHYSNSNKLINFEDSKIIYKALNTDLSSILKDNNISKVSIQLGQPVKVFKIEDNWQGTLRIALSSNLISEIAMLDDDFIKMRFSSDIDMINNKIKLIIDNFDLIKSSV